MARNALAKFGLAAVYIEAAKPASSTFGDHWVVQVTGTDGETRLIEVDEVAPVPVDRFHYPTGDESGD